VQSIVINPSVGASLCLSVCLRAYLWNRWTDLHEIVCQSLVAMAWSSSGGVALRYVFSVLWIMSCLAAIGVMPKGGRCTVLWRRWMTWRYRGQSLMSMNACYKCDLAFVLKSEPK